MGGQQTQPQQLGTPVSPQAATLPCAPDVTYRSPDQSTHQTEICTGVYTLPVSHLSDLRVQVAAPVYRCIGARADARASAPAAGYFPR